MSSEKIIALVDCNSFYCSCERVFNPSLEGKPVIVLSNNDGCAIARTDEAKAIGIKMGAPFFKIKDVIKKHNIHVFSSNYTLYGDMSRRVMEILREYTPELEIYSIDEAFLDLTGFKKRDLIQYSQDIRQRVLKLTGIPVSIGLGPTKVLAKVANRLLKKDKIKNQGVFSVLDPLVCEQALNTFPIEDIWGISRKSTQKLHDLRIYTARQLRDANETLIQKKLTVVGARIMQELKAVSCLDLEQVQQDKKNICSSRSFGRPVFAKEELQEAIANHVHTATEKLRRQKSIARSILIFIQTNPFKNIPQYYNSTTIELPSWTSVTTKLIHQAFYGLDSIYKSGFEYKKCGIILNDIIPKSESQLDFFGSPSITGAVRTFVILG